MSFSFDLGSGIEVKSGLDQPEFFADFDEGFTDDELELLGVDPKIATGAKPGSEEKVSMLAARYAAGLPLWHHEDRYDHAPEVDTEFEDEEIDD